MTDQELQKIADETMDKINWECKVDLQRNEVIFNALTKARDAQEEKLRIAKKTLKYYATHPHGGMRKASYAIERMGVE